jgi:glycine betaine/proline transport system substrate-binding protein
MLKSKFLFIFMSAVLISSLFLVGGCTEKEESAVKPAIKLVQGDWTSQIVLTKICEEIIRDKLGYPVETTMMSVSMGWPAMNKGDIDIATEIWLPGRLPEVEPFIESGTLELAGEVYPGGSGWAVQRWVVEGDAERGIEPLAPDLKSILDLKDESEGGKGYWKLFESPENPGLGEVVYGSPGWNVPDRWMILGYDLPLWESYQSENVMMARMIAADKKEQPLLLSIWWPHWIFSAVDLIILEEPDPYFEELDYESDPYPLKTGHPIYSVQKVVRADLADKAPDVYRLMQNLVLTEDEINAIMMRVEVDEEDPIAVAKQWVSENQAKIDAWLK